MSDEEYDEYCYPSDKFTDVALAKAIKKILHPMGFENLYPETEDELGNPKILAIIQLTEQHREAYATEKEAKLLNALGEMYAQYCGKPYGHDFMGAGEGAIEILEDYGIHDERLEWDEKSYDKLEKKVAELRKKVGRDDQRE